MANGVGARRLIRSAMGERAEGRKRLRAREREDGGLWHLRGVARTGRRGSRRWKQEVELGCARVDTASSSWQKLGDDWQGRLVGWANWASSR